MNEEEFWKIIESAGAPDTCGIDEQCEKIVAALTGRSKESLVGFETIRGSLAAKAYTWPMLKACFITLSYVSDDVFDDFRNWLILNGKDRFYRAIENPDFIAEFAKVEDPIEEISGEPLLFAIEEAWDGDIEEIEDDVPVAAEPDLGDDWPPKETLQKEFPNLFAAFWNEEQIAKIHSKD